MGCAYNATLEGEAAEGSEVRSQLQLHTEFQVSMDHMRVWLTEAVEKEKKP